MYIKNVQLLNFGSLIAFDEERTFTNESLTGYYIHSSGINFINQLDTLESAIGLSFGIEYYLEGFNNSQHEDVHFISRIIHPTITNPTSNESISETVERKYTYLNEANYDYFQFEYDWEVKSGIWTFQVIEDDTVLLEKRFTIN